MSVEKKRLRIVRYFAGRYGHFATPPWIDRKLLLFWLRRKYPKTWREFEIQRWSMIRVRELPARKKAKHAK